MKGEKKEIETEIGKRKKKTIKLKYRTKQTDKEKQGQKPPNVPFFFCDDNAVFHRESYSMKKQS